MTETQLQLIPGEEELDFEFRTYPMETFRDVEVPIPPKRDLIESIRLVGMLQPPIFREDADGKLDIVIGRRRIAAAQLAGLESVRVFVAKTSAAVADVMTLAENAIRSANTVTEFEAIERLTKQGMDIKTIRAMTGMAQQTIKKRQGLLRLVPELADAFRAGRMTATVADGAAKLPVTLQKELALTLVAEKKITASDLHEVRQASTQAAMQSALFDNLGEPEDGDESDAALDDPRDIEPIEAVLAREIQSVIDRLPAYIAKQQLTIFRSLSWAAAALLDLAMGQGAEDDRPIAAHHADGTWTVPNDEMVREIDPKYADAPVEQPDRVFTLTRIETADITTDDLPAGNPPPRKPRKPRKLKDQKFDDTTDPKFQKLSDEDEFIAGFVG